MESFVGVLVLSIILFAGISALTTASGRSLQSKFVALGTLKGKKKGYIISKVGQPNSFSTTADGKQILQWMAAGYHICLIFDDNTCEGVSHEFSGN